MNIECTKIEYIYRMNIECILKLFLKVVKVFSKNKNIKIYI